MNIFEQFKSHSTGNNLMVSSEKSQSSRVGFVEHEEGGSAYWAKTLVSSSNSGKGANWVQVSLRGDGSDGVGYRLGKRPDRNSRCGLKGLGLMAS